MVMRNVNEGGVNLSVLKCFLFAGRFRQKIEKLWQGFLIEIEKGIYEDDVSTREDVFAR